MQPVEPLYHCISPLHLNYFCKTMTWLFFVFQFGFFILATIIILDLARIATFLFYKKDKTQLTSSIVVKSPVGGSLFSLKNMVFVCIIVPTPFLFYVTINQVPRLFSVAGLHFILAYYTIAVAVFILLAFSSKIHQKLQIKSHSRKKIILLFIFEICLLIFVLFLALKMETMTLFQPKTA